MLGRGLGHKSLALLALAGPTSPVSLRSTWLRLSSPHTSKAVCLFPQPSLTLFAVLGRGLASHKKLVAKRSIFKVALLPKNRRTKSLLFVINRFALEQTGSLRLSSPHTSKAVCLFPQPSLTLFAVLGRGLEPPRDCSHRLLKPACLPFHHPSAPVRNFTVSA